MKSQLFDFAKLIDELKTKPYFSKKSSQPSFSLHNALEIDLKAQTIAPITISENITRNYLGGRALAIRLFAEYAVGNDPYRNPIIIASGPTNNSLTPYSDSFSIAFQSPVTKRLEVFSSLLKTGSCMRTLDLDAIIVLGESLSPVVISISENPALKSLENLQTLPTSLLEERLRSSKEESIILTGPAADNKSPLSCAVSEKTTLGRGGLGLLMSQKNIKAFVVSPKKDRLKAPLQTKINDKKEKKHTALTRISKAVEQSRYLGKTEFNVLDKGSKAGFVPVANFGYQTDPRIFFLLSKDDVSKDLYRKRAPSPLLQNSSEKLPYSPVAMLGPNLDCFNLEKIKAWMNECLELGLDPVSVGNLLGWAVDERKNGRLKDYPEIDGLLKKNILRIIRSLANPRGKKLWGLMGKGAKALKESPDFNTENLFEILDLECGPYDYRGYRSMALEDFIGSFLTCPCEIFMPLYDEKPRVLAKYIVWNNNLAEGLESAGFSHLLLGPLMCEKESLGSFVCFFFPSLFLKFFNPKTLSKRFFEISGKKMRSSAFRDIGKKCFLLENGINKVLCNKEPKFPSRFACEVSASKSQGLSFVKLYEYYQKERLSEN